MDDRSRSLLVELRQAIDDALEGREDVPKIVELAGAVERRARAQVELTDDDDTLAEQLYEAAVKLEAEQPTLARALRRAVDLLGAVGL